MKNFLPLILLFCLNVHPVTAEESAPPPPAVTTLTTLTGKTYEGITSIKREPNKLRILHSSGAATVRLDELDEATRRLFNFDPAKSAAADAADAELARAQSVVAVEQDAQFAAMEAADARKKEAYNWLASRVYKDDSFLKERFKKEQDQRAIKRLMYAGYDRAGAELALAELKRTGAMKKEKIHPAFVKTPEDIRAQLRGVPNGTTRNK